MFGRYLARLNSDQRKLMADLFNTNAKLFVGGGLVSPFLNQSNLGWIGSGAAFAAGVAFHALALYILSVEEGGANAD